MCVAFKSHCEETLNPFSEKQVLWRKLNFQYGQPTMFQMLRILCSSWNVLTKFSEGPGEEAGWAENGHHLGK